MTVHTEWTVNAARRSTRVSVPRVVAEPLIDRHHNEANLEGKEVHGMGNVLFTKTAVTQHAIICTYNGDAKGTIITDKAKAERASRSPYTVVVPDGDHWVRVDVRDRASGKST